MPHDHVVIELVFHFVIYLLRMSDGYGVGGFELVALENRKQWLCKIDTVDMIFFLIVVEWCRCVWYNGKW